VLRGFSWPRGRHVEHCFHGAARRASLQERAPASGVDARPYPGEFAQHPTHALRRYGLVLPPRSSPPRHPILTLWALPNRGACPVARGACLATLHRPRTADPRSWRAVILPLRNRQAAPGRILFSAVPWPFAVPPQMHIVPLGAAARKTVYAVSPPRVLGAPSLFGMPRRRTRTFPGVRVVLAEWLKGGC
jgi:hypothetical protein